MNLQKKNVNYNVKANYISRNINPDLNSNIISNSNINSRLIKTKIEHIPQKSKKNDQKINQNNYYIKNEISIIRSSPRKKIEATSKELNFAIEKNTNYTNIKKLNDEELNILTYKEAIKLDKRTYCQYYWALLKKKQIILFAFISTTDYNIRIIKIALFIVSFSLYFTINGFFFSDDTMHKVYLDNGAYNFLYRIPQILYSSIVSSVINMILKQLSLSEKDIIKIHREKDFNIVKKKSEETKNCLLIKLSIFFTLSLILMAFFWYFIACFCAVYKNTQLILIKDTLVSFALSMSYPFGLNLLPGFFRMPALRAKRKNKKCLYTISGLVALV